MKEWLGHALKRGDRINLHRARMCFGFDGVALWRQFRAVPTDDMALPCCTRLLSNAFSQPKRRWQWRWDLMIVCSPDSHATLFHIQPFVKTARLVELPVPVRSRPRNLSVWDASDRSCRQQGLQDPSQGWQPGDFIRLRLFNPRREVRTLLARRDASTRGLTFDLSGWP